MVSFTGSITPMTRGAEKFKSSLIECSKSDMSIIFSRFATPAVSTKLRSALGVYPLLLRPEIVGSLGSSQSFTILFSISSRSFLLLVTV